MKKNLIIIISTAAILASSTAAFAETTPAAEELNVMPISETTDIEFKVPVSMPSYIVNTVTVTEITEERISTTTDKEDAENPENTINFTILENTLVLASNGEKKTVEDIKKDENITVFTSSYSPTPLILPPLYQADVIIINDEEQTSFVDVDTYLADGERLVNAANTLELNIDEKTEIVDTESKTVEEKDLDKKDLAVIYSASTKSIPAQTTPIKIVVLGENETALAQIEAAKNEEAATPEVTPAPADTPENDGDIEVNFIKVNSIKVEGKSIENVYYLKDDYNEGNPILMVPLREIAEALGMTVDWNDEMRTVILNDGIYSLQIDENSYIKGKMMPVQLSAAPEIRDGLTYVPVEYFIDVVEANTNVNLDENGYAESIDFSITEIAE